MGFERIDDLLNGVTADGSLHGVAATVVGRDGVLYEGAAGEAKPDTMFRNASMTKAVATTAALQLVEQGRVQLDATVASIVPEFGELQVLDGFEGGEPVLRAPKTQATVRQLMSHTAGCGYHFVNEKLFAYCTDHEPTFRLPGASGSTRNLQGFVHADFGIDVLEARQKSGCVTAQFGRQGHSQADSDSRRR